MPELKLGDKVKCKYTGFQGVANGRAEHLNGCIRWSVQPLVDKDGKLPEAYWLDECQLELVESYVEHVPVKTGGPEARSNVTERA